jgi:UDP-MurNAc hydroxylase
VSVNAKITSVEPSARKRLRGHVAASRSRPSSTATITPGACEVEQPVPDVPAFFAGKEEYLRAYQQRQRPVIEAEKAAWPHPELDVLAALTDRVQPLMAQSEHIANGIGGPIRFDLTDDADEVVESIVFDFTAREIRAAAGERVRYRFRTRRTLIEHLLATGETDWVNSLFLSCRFSAARIGQYNEYVYTFFKCLDQDRLQYAEGWYAEQTTDVEDIVIGDWAVQGLCPHLKANLERFGKLDGTVLTCQMHGWKFDLPTGRCVTSAGPPIRARRVGEPQADAAG